MKITRNRIIMKLEFRVPFDTDIDVVRKIVKKINKRIAKDEELGKELLSKVKSQGVKEVDDVGMVIRIKFKTRPGGQFTIRKEAHRLLRETFAEKGIEFAHRKVTVNIPGPIDPAALEQGVAAGAAAQFDAPGRDSK